MMRTPLRRCPGPLLCLALLSPLPSAPADESPREKKVSASLRPFAEKQPLAGAVVLVANKDKTLALEAVGYSDVENKTPMKTDALFWIAPQSKPITAAAVMLLVDDGK